jgi:competence protein ComEC
VTVDLRLAMPVGVAWVTVGVLLGLPRLLPGAALLLWGAAALILLVALALRGRGYGRLRVVLGGLVVALAATALLVSVAAVQAADRQPAALVEAAQAGRFVTATAIVTQTVQSGGEASASSQRQAMFSATLGSVTVGGMATAVDIPVTVFAEHPHRTIGIGATVTVAGTLSATDPADDVAFRLFAARGVRVDTEAPWFLDWANGLRSRFRDAAGALP